MKYYIAEAITNSKLIRIKKRFATRDEAINYVFRLLPHNAQVEEEINKGNHKIEYRCNNYNRFTVTRQLA